MLQRSACNEHLATEHSQSQVGIPGEDIDSATESSSLSSKSLLSTLNAAGTPRRPARPQRPHRYSVDMTSIASTAQIYTVVDEHLASPINSSGLGVPSSTNTSTVSVPLTSPVAQASPTLRHPISCPSNSGGFTPTLPPIPARLSLTDSRALTPLATLPQPSGQAGNSAPATPPLASLAEQLSPRPAIPARATPLRPASAPFPPFSPTHTHADSLPSSVASVPHTQSLMLAMPSTPATTPLADALAWPARARGNSSVISTAAAPPSPSTPFSLDPPAATPCMCAAARLLVDRVLCTDVVPLTHDASDSFSATTARPPSSSFSSCSSSAAVSDSSAHGRGGDCGEDSPWGAAALAHGPSTPVALPTDADADTHTVARAEAFPCPVPLAPAPSAGTALSSIPESPQASRTRAPALASPLFPGFEVLAHALQHAPTARARSSTLAARASPADGHAGEEDRPAALMPVPPSFLSADKYTYAPRLPLSFCVAPDGGLPYLADFAESKFCEENVRFWEHVCRYRSLVADPHVPGEAVAETLQHLLRRFLLVGAPEELNIASGLRKETVRAVSLQLGTGVFTADVLDTVAAEVFRMLDTEIYRPFTQQRTRGGGYAALVCALLSPLVECVDQRELAMEPEVVSNPLVLTMLLAHAQSRVQAEQRAAERERGLATDAGGGEGAMEAVPEELTPIRSRRASLLDAIRSAGRRLDSTSVSGGTTSRTRRESLGAAASTETIFGACVRREAASEMDADTVASSVPVDGGLELLEAVVAAATRAREQVRGAVLRAPRSGSVSTVDAVAELGASSTLPASVSVPHFALYPSIAPSVAARDAPNPVSASTSILSPAALAPHPTCVLAATASPPYSLDPHLHLRASAPSLPAPVSAAGEYTTLAEFATPATPSVPANDGAVPSSCASAIPAPASTPSLPQPVSSPARYALMQTAFLASLHSARVAELQPAGVWFALYRLSALLPPPLKLMLHWAVQRARPLPGGTVSRVVLLDPRAAPGTALRMSNELGQLPKGYGYTFCLHSAERVCAACVAAADALDAHLPGADVYRWRDGYECAVSSASSPIHMFALTRTLEVARLGMVPFAPQPPLLSPAPVVVYSVMARARRYKSAIADIYTARAQRTTPSELTRRYAVEPVAPPRPPLHAHPARMATAPLTTSDPLFRYTIEAKDARALGLGAHSSLCASEYPEAYLHPTDHLTAVSQLRQRLLAHIRGQRPPLHVAEEAPPQSLSRALPALTVDSASVVACEPSPEYQSQQRHTPRDSNVVPVPTTAPAATTTTETRSRLQRLLRCMRSSPDTPVHVAEGEAPTPRDEQTPSSTSAMESCLRASDAGSVPAKPANAVPASLSRTADGELPPRGRALTVSSDPSPPPPIAPPPKLQRRAAVSPRARANTTLPVAVAQADDAAMRRLLCRSWGLHRGPGCSFCDSVQQPRGRRHSTFDTSVFFQPMDADNRVRVVISAEALLRDRATRLLALLADPAALLPGPLPEVANHLLNVHPLTRGSVFAATRGGSKISTTGAPLPLPTTLSMLTAPPLPSTWGPEFPSAPSLAPFLHPVAMFPLTQALLRCSHPIAFPVRCAAAHYPASPPTLPPMPATTHTHTPLTPPVANLALAAQRVLRMYIALAPDNSLAVCALHTIDSECTVHICRFHLPEYAFLRTTTHTESALAVQRSVLKLGATSTDEALLSSALACQPTAVLRMDEGASHSFPAGAQPSVAQVLDLCTAALPALVPTIQSHMAHVERTRILSSTDVTAAAIMGPLASLLAARTSTVQCVCMCAASQDCTRPVASTVSMVTELLAALDNIAVAVSGSLAELFRSWQRTAEYHMLVADLCELRDFRAGLAAQPCLDCMREVGRAGYSTLRLCAHRQARRGVHSARGSMSEPEYASVKVFDGMRTCASASSVGSLEDVATYRDGSFLQRFLMPARIPAEAPAASFGSCCGCYCHFDKHQHQRLTLALKAALSSVSQSLDL